MTTAAAKRSAGLARLVAAPRASARPRGLPVEGANHRKDMLNIPEHLLSSDKTCNRFLRLDCNNRQPASNQLTARAEAKGSDEVQRDAKGAKGLGCRWGFAHPVA